MSGKREHRKYGKNRRDSAADSERSNTDRAVLTVKTSKGELRRRIVGILIIIFGIGFYLYPDIREWQMNVRTQAIIREYEEKYGASADLEALLNGDADSTDRTSGSENDADTESENAGESDISAEAESVREADSSAGGGASGSVDASALAALYDEMEAYNQDLIENGQLLTDAWSYAQTPVDLSALHSSGDDDAAGNSNDAGNGDAADPAEASDGDSAEASGEAAAAAADDAIGYIVLPDMSVALPLYIGASAENMAKGAAVLSETSMPIGGESTNCVIAGHRGYSGMPYFREIEKLEIGSFIYIINPWETLHYRVVQIEIIEPDDVDSILIVQGKDLVTLLTCHPYMSHGKYRYVVYCERVTDEAEEDGDPDGADELSDDTMNGSGADGEDTAYSVSSGNALEVGSSEWLIRVERMIRVAVPVILILIFAIDALRRRSGKNEKHS